MKIHPGAIVEPNAKLGSGVTIGPFCHVGGNVTLEDDVELVSHVSIGGKTRIGEKTKIFPFAAIGHSPQDLKYKGEESAVTIGSNNSIREYVTVQPGTSGDKMETKVGNHCLLMVGSHVAHDCVVKDHVVMANNATLAGHVTVGDYAIIGGLSAVKQFVRVGAHAIIGGMTGVERDVIPFGMVIGERGWLNGLNLVGLKRRGFDRNVIRKLQDVYATVFMSNDNTLSERLELTRKKYESDGDVSLLLDFLNGDSKSLCQPKNNP